MAAQNGNSAIVRLLLLEHKADVEETRIGSHTPLFVAAQNGHIETVKILLEHKADANIRTLDGTKRTPLLIAAQNGHSAIVKLLLKHKADIELIGNDWCFPLLVAVQNGHIETVRMLLAHGANANGIALDGTRRTLLLIAAQNGHSAIVKLLLEHKADIERTGNDLCPPLLVAAQNGHIETVRMLLEHGADANGIALDGTERTPLFIALQNGHFAVAKVLLAKGANPDQRVNGVSPFFSAAQKGNLEIVELLLEHKADIEQTGSDSCPPLFVAAQNGHIETVKMLLEHKADVNGATLDGTGRTPLFIAAQNGHFEIVKLLLGHGANPNYSTVDGIMPLQIARENKHDDIAILLTASPQASSSSSSSLASVTTISIFSPAATTPVPVAISAPNLDAKSVTALERMSLSLRAEVIIQMQISEAEIVKLLKENNVNLGIALQEAVYKNNIGLVKFLIAENADVNYVNGYKFTALHIAAWNGNIALVALLLDSKANINATGKHNATALHIAAGDGRKDVFDLLIEKKADFQIRNVKGATANDLMDKMLLREHSLKSGDSGPIDLRFYLYFKWKNENLEKNLKNAEAKKEDTALLTQELDRVKRLHQLTHYSGQDVVLAGQCIPFAELIIFCKQIAKKHGKNSRLKKDAFELLIDDLHVIRMWNGRLSDLEEKSKSELSRVFERVLNAFLQTPNRLKFVLGDETLDLPLQSITEKKEVSTSNFSVESSTQYYCRDPKELAKFLKEYPEVLPRDREILCIIKPYFIKPHFVNSRSPIINTIGHSFSISRADKVVSIDDQAHHINCADGQYDEIAAAIFDLRRGYYIAEQGAEGFLMEFNLIRPLKGEAKEHKLSLSPVASYPTTVDLLRQRPLSEQKMAFSLHLLNSIDNGDAKTVEDLLFTDFFKTDFLQPILNMEFDSYLFSAIRRANLEILLLFVRTNHFKKPTQDESYMFKLPPDAIPELIDNRDIIDKIIFPYRSSQPIDTPLFRKNFFEVIMEKKQVNALKKLLQWSSDFIELLENPQIIAAKTLLGDESMLMDKTFQISSAKMTTFGSSGSARHGVAVRSSLSAVAKARFE